MKIIHQLFLLVILTASLFPSCDFSGSKENEQKKLEEGMLPDDDKKYQFKSAIIKMKSAKQVFGSDIETTIYLDDFGEKYCAISDTKLKYKGGEIVNRSVTLTKNDFNYIYSPEKKTGTKAKNKGNFNPMHADFSNITAATMEQFGIREEGTIENLGRECIVYVIENPDLQMKGRYEVWNKIPLRYSTQIGESSLEMYAVDVLENATIPDSIFQLPSEIEFTEAINPLSSGSAPSLSDSQLNRLSQGK